MKREDEERDEFFDDEPHRDRSLPRKGFPAPGSEPDRVYTDQELYDAIRWLEKLLKQGDLYQRDVQVLAENCGVPLSLLQRAKKRLGVISRNVNCENPHALWKLWLWSLPRKRSLLDMD
jgi:hypothetical protein